MQANEGIGLGLVMAYNLVMTIAKTGILLRDKHKLTPAIWLVALYIATALTAGIDASPDGGLALFLFETRHVMMHASVFAIQTWLVANALQLPRDGERRYNGMLLILLILTLGIGQEALQSLYRHEIRTFASLWDLLVDIGGGAGGWWLYTRWLHKIHHWPSTVGGKQTWS
jgi:hypothetical protein